LLAIVLQARLDSTRLPEKSMLPLGGKPLIFRVMQALNFVPAQMRILACPEDSGSSFAPLAEEAGFQLFAGPKEDVLARYCLAIRRFGISRLIRATGDNPFVFADAAAAINAEAMALNAEYAGYSGLPLGAGVESVDAAALLRAQAEAVSSFEKEHVCPCLYGHPELFRLHRPLAPVRWQDICEEPSTGKIIRLTVDTQEDFRRAQELYAGLENGPGRFQGQTIIKRYREIFHT
jgi:spore coat polysaccharide biosynthesis protein SpsF